MDQRRFLVVLVAGLALAAACNSEPAEISRAREVLASSIAADPGYHEYALTVTKGSNAAHAKALRLDAMVQGSRTVAGEAIHAVGDSPDAETLAALSQAFAGSGSVKLAAAAVLARNGNTEAVEWLAGQLRQTGYLLSTPAMVALAENGHEEAVRNSLGVLVANDDVTIRNEGYEMLGAIGETWATGMLLNGLEREFGEERAGPIVALGKTGDASVALKIRDWVGIQGLVLASLEALGNLGDAEAMQQVGPMLAHEQPLVRLYAAIAAAKLGAMDQASEAVSTLLTDESPDIRMELAVQLAGIEDAAATGWLMDLTGDTEKTVRAEAFRALIGRDAAGLGEAFARGAQDTEYEVATVALTGLAEAGDASQVAGVAPLLDSENPYLAIGAAHVVLSLAGDQG